MTTNLEPWTVGGLLAAPSIEGAAGEMFGCRIDPLAHLTMSPIAEEMGGGGQIAFGPGSGPIPHIQRLGARLRFAATHQITTAVLAEDDRSAIEEAGRRFRTCAAALVVSSQSNQILSSGLESAVLVVWAETPKVGRQSAVGLRMAFGPILTSSPTSGSKNLMAILEAASAKNAKVGRWLSALYEADERAFLSDEEDQDRQILDYCRIIEDVAGAVAKEYRQTQTFPNDLAVAYERIARDLLAALTGGLATESGSKVNPRQVTRAIKLVRDSERSIKRANLESAWHRIEHAAAAMAVPEAIISAASKAWIHRSRSVAHPGDERPVSAAWEARIAAVVFISYFANHAVFGSTPPIDSNSSP